MKEEHLKKVAEHTMRLLKVRTVSFPLLITEKGTLNIKYVKDQESYELILDAVPLDMNEYDHKELKAMLQKYLLV